MAHRNETLTTLRILAHRWALLGWVLTATLLEFENSAAARDSETLKIDDAVAAIERAEATIRCVEFKCEAILGLAEMRNGQWRILQSNRQLGSSSSNVRYRPGARIYRVEIDEVARASIGNVPRRDGYYASHVEYSNDGTTFRTWRRGTVGKDVPKPDAAGPNIEKRGLISPSTDEAKHVQGIGFLQLRGHQCGITWVSPYVHPILEPAQKLSVLLREKKDGGDFVRARILESGTWEIHYISKRTSKSIYEFRVSYDPVAGRVVTCEWGRSESPDPDWADWSCVRVAQLIYSDRKSKIPARVIVVEMNGQPHSSQWTYRKQRLNPDVEKKDFVVEFAPGVEVEDHIRRRRFVVGEMTPTDETPLDTLRE